jgi:outer membrane protein assembly factor BamB
LRWSTTLQVRPPASEPAEDDAPVIVGDKAGGAAPTPVTDGQFIYAFFADGVLGCVDSAGKQVWARRLVEGGPKNGYGLAASPVLYDDLVIQVIDRGPNADAKASFIVAVRAKDGGQVWRADRPVISCWTTPLIVRQPGGDVMVTTAPPLVIAYDPRTGRQFWQAEGSSNDELASSPVRCGEGAVAVEASRGLTAFKVAGKGDVTNTGVVWKSDARPPEVASPACGTGKCFLLVNENLVCIDAATGRKAWDLELAGRFWASPVVAGDRVYAINKAGVLFVVSTDGKKLDEVELGDPPVRATPAIIDGRVYIRTAGRLLCIGRR